MTAYAIAVLGTTPGAPHPDVLTYIERVQSTFAPYGGRFLSHGKKGEWMEGEPVGDIVMVEFPDLAAAHAWYASPAYQEILPLRTKHLPGSLVILEGVPETYDASRTAARLRESTAAAPPSASE